MAQCREAASRHSRKFLWYFEWLGGYHASSIEKPSGKADIRNDHFLQLILITGQLAVCSAQFAK